MNGATQEARIALAFLHAWTSGDGAAARMLCHEDLTFRGPVEHRNGAAVHVSALMEVSRGVRRLEISKVVQSGRDVVIIYDLFMAPRDVVVSIAEVNVVTDGQLVSVRAFFDTQPLRVGP